jgi:hypothetical protein
VDTESTFRRTLGGELASLPIDDIAVADVVLVEGDALRSSWARSALRSISQIKAQYLPRWSD